MITILVTIISGLCNDDTPSMFDIHKKKCKIPPLIMTPELRKRLGPVA